MDTRPTTNGDIRGRTPLHLACEDGTIDIVKALLARHNIDVNMKDMFRKTPLHLACYYGRRIWSYRI